MRRHCPCGNTRTSWPKSDVPFDLSDESDGTRKLFEFTGGWVRALTIGATLFVDELDRSLHPYITRFLVTLFQGNKNAKNAQLIFTTHDTMPSMRSVVMYLFIPGFRSRESERS